MYAIPASELMNCPIPSAHSQGYLDAQADTINWRRRLRDDDYRAGCVQWEKEYPPNWSTYDGFVWTER